MRDLSFLWEIMEIMGITGITGIMKKGKKPAGFLPFYYQFSINYTPMMALTSRSTIGIVMQRMPMKSMMTPDLIIFVMGT